MKDLTIESNGGNFQGTRFTGEDKNIEVQIFDSFEELSSRQEEWDQFVESTGGEIFLTYDWCRVWWKYYGRKREPRIFIFKKNNAIIGIMPFFKDKIWLGPFCLKFMKIIGTDYTFTTVSLPIIKEFVTEILRDFLKNINLRDECDIIHFGPLSGRFDNYERFFAACEHIVDKNCKILANNNEAQTYFKIEDSWDSQIASLSHEQRRAMRRKYERILKEGRSIECITAAEENFNKIFDEFVKLHQLHWESQRKSGHFGAWPNSYDFHHDVATIQLKRGRLRLVEIQLDGKIIGYNYGYKFGNTYYYLLFGRGSFENENKTDFVRIDFGEMVKRAIKENVKWFDTMRGRYEYKLHLGGELFPIRNIYIVSNRLKDRMRIACIRLLAKGLDLCYSKIWRSRIAPRVGIKVGPFWDKWIKSQTFSS